MEMGRNYIAPTMGTIRVKACDVLCGSPEDTE